MVQRVYVGPHDEVEIWQTGQIVKRGEAVDVDGDLAESLDEQPDAWAKPSTKAAKSAPKPKNPPEQEPTTVDGQPIDPEETP